MTDGMTKMMAQKRGSAHYKKSGIEPIQYIMENKLDFCEGNVVKYITRWKFKDGVADLQKARHYLDFLIEAAQPKV